MPEATAADTLVSQWLQAELEESPVRATQLGAEGHDDRLGTFSAADFERRARADRSWADRFGALPRDELGDEQAIDVDLVLANLAGRAVMEDWEVWKRDPATYVGVCMQGVFSLFVHRLKPEPELARSATSRLREVPGVLDAGRANLDPELASPLIVERALRSCSAGVSYARDLVPQEVQDPDLRAEVARAGSVAAEALENFASHLAELRKGATGSYAIGEARYSGVLRDRELLSYGAGEMRDRGRRAWAELDAEMTDLARAVDPGTKGWHDAVAGLLLDHPSTPEEMRATYDETTASARRFSWSVSSSRFFRGKSASSSRRLCSSDRSWPSPSTTRRLPSHRQ
jgi:uncharacterized protein (DUF885 family)